MTMECGCCKDFLWHCKFCWNKNHNGKKDNDYIAPKYVGQPFNEEVLNKMKRILAEKALSEIELNKDKKYEEHIYGHNR